MKKDIPYKNIALNSSKARENRAGLPHATLQPRSFSDLPLHPPASPTAPSQSRAGRIVVVLLPVLFVACAFLFFWRFLPFHLHYQEQFQMFLFTKSYFFETCARPGGFGNYAGRFITQFYISTPAGALLVSCLLIAIQQLTYSLARRFYAYKVVSRVTRHASHAMLHMTHDTTATYEPVGADLRVCPDKTINKTRTPLHPIWQILSFIPALFYWYLLCSEDTQVGGMVALLLTLITAFTGTMIKSGFARRTYLFVSIPVLYWLVGGTVIVSVILLIVYEWLCCRKATRHYMTLCVFSFATLSCVTVLPLLAKYLLQQYPLSRFWWGVDYMHFVNYSPSLILWLWLLTVLVIITPKVLTTLFPSSLPQLFNYSITQFFSSSLPQLFNYSIIQFFSSSIIQLFNYSILLSLLIYLVIFHFAYPQNRMKEEIMAYDYHCRMKNWDKVIEMADRKSPTVPMTVTCLNLALYQTGQLPAKMFDYFQNGPEGLLPTFQRDYMIATVGGEPYWYLGFVNTAQRFAFEAMEALPDYQKSVRSIKRLAEANLVNGNYRVASKYLYMLENTLFYSRWAKETRTYLYDDAKIDAHPEWGAIRRFRIDDDFLFSEKEKDRMLGVYFQHRRDNRMAYEYLMAYALLTKDLRNFPDYYGLSKEFTYREIPKSYQEALVYIWGLSNNDLNAIPFPVSTSVKQQVGAYAQIYTTMPSPEAALQRQFSKTYWYYYHFRKYNQANTERPLQY